MPSVTRSPVPPSSDPCLAREGAPRLARSSKALAESPCVSSAQVTDGSAFDIDPNGLWVVWVRVLQYQHSVNDSVLAVVVALATNGFQRLLIVRFSHNGQRKC